MANALPAQLFSVTVKFAESLLTSPTLRVPSPVFETVTVWAVEVSPTVVVPKSRALWETPITGFSPDPERFAVTSLKIFSVAT